MQKISVIIPIYNSEKFLPACLDSILHQTYQNLEIILVNDGSTDACPQICEDYAQKDQRIVVIHKQNGGLSDARNAGMSKATGELISFVDSDDLVSPDFCKILIKALVENKADIAECNFSTFENLEEIPLQNTISDQTSGIFDTETAQRMIIEGPLSVVVWNKIYKLETLTEIPFPVGKINEDVDWTYKVFARAKKIVKISDVLYFYRQHDQSIMGKGYSLKFLDGFYALENKIDFIINNFPKLETLMIRSYCFVAMGHYQQLNRNAGLDPEKHIRHQIYSKVKKYDKWKILKKWNWKDIVWYQFFNWSPNLYLAVRDYVEKSAIRKQSKNQ